jgi:hypothetical protein
MPIETWKDLVDKAKSVCLKGMPQSAQMTFAADPSLDSEIRPNEHYFGLTINEIRLQYGQEFHKTYDPLIYLAIDFLYGNERITVPKLIGPSALGGLKADTDGKPPHGFVVQDIRVVGPHPYRGEQVGVTLVLYKVAHTNYAKRVLGFAEKLSNAIGFPADISTVLKIGEPVIDAIETLFDMQDSVPIMGRRFELNASPLDGFQPQYVALINGVAKPPQGLKVVGRALVQSSGDAYDGSDYVLYNLWRKDTRGSHAGLPFQQMLQKMYECGLAGDVESWRRGKSMLVAVYEQLIGSSDLTEADAERTFETYKEKLLKCKERAGLISLMSATTNEKVSLAEQQRRLMKTRLNDNAREIFSLPD